jgi:hypothetical protein
MHYDDLTPLTYFGEELADKLVAVGWLTHGHAHARGEVAEPVMRRLAELMRRPWAPSYFMGLEECTFCEHEFGVARDAGGLNLFVPGDGFLYVMPELAKHYIQAHGYAPPAEFCDALLRCPPMGTPEYFRAFAECAPPEYARFARAKLAAA